MEEVNSTACWLSYCPILEEWTVNDIWSTFEFGLQVLFDEDEVKKLTGEHFFKFAKVHPNLIEEYVPLRGFHLRHALQEMSEILVPNLFEELDADKRKHYYKLRKEIYRLYEKDQEYLQKLGEELEEIDRDEN